MNEGEKMARERVKIHTIGERIKWLRQNKPVHYSYHEKDYEEVGISQKNLADVLNVSLDTVKNWEQGYNYPTIEMIYDILKVIKILIGIIKKI